MSVVLSCGKWGGFYLHRGYTTLLCMGFVALTFVPEEFEDLCDRLMQKGGK